MLKKVQKAYSFKVLLLTIPSVMIIAVIISFINSRTSVNNIIPETIPVNKEATLSIGKVHQVSTKNGVKEWALEANSSQYYMKKNIVEFTKLKITFFTKDTQKYYLTANHGTLNTKNKNMTVSGDVIVTDKKNRRINAKKLHYDKKRHILYSNKRIELHDKFSTISADSIEIKLNQGEILFIGDVKGSFSETIKFN